MSDSCRYNEQKTEEMVLCDPCGTDLDDDHRMDCEGVDMKRNEIRLVRPEGKYADQVMAYKKEMEQASSGMDGCAGLEDVKSYEEWIDFEHRLKRKYGEGYVPSDVFLAIRNSDERLVGIIDYRHPLSPFLLRYGGNIGYSVRPDERRKGYAKMMLAQVLEYCWECGETKVLVTCDPENSGSRKTIEDNGGILENIIVDEIGISGHGHICRFWIDRQM